MFLFLKKLALFSLFLLVGLELVFRTVIPAAEIPAGFQDPVYQIMSLDQDVREDGHNSLGRLGRPRFAWHVNNFGFNSIYDYKIPADREAPCVAVIGNSFVEGLYGDADKHLAAQIQTAMGPAAEVYNLGTTPGTPTPTQITASFNTAIGRLSTSSQLGPAPQEVGPDQSSKDCRRAVPLSRTSTRSSTPDRRHQPHHRS